MDYKALIGKLIFWRDVFLINSMEECKELLSDAATAIETLLAEREAAVEDLRGRCIKCKHFSAGILDFPRTDCRYEGGSNDHWQWRGPQKGGDG